MVSADLLGAARAIESQIAEDRRRIHSHPELAYEEEETSSLVRTRLEELGIPFLSGLAKTGVVATIKGDLGDGRCLLLRADMDALPIDERSGVRFASQIPGVMHACGHDAHTAMLLGAARLLLDRRTGFAGTVKLMFQPAEEGAGGAPRMIEAGVLTDPPSTPPSLCTSVQTSLLGRFPVPPDRSLLAPTCSRSPLRAAAVTRRSLRRLSMQSWSGLRWCLRSRPWSRARSIHNDAMSVPAPDQQTYSKSRFSQAPSSQREHMQVADCLATSRNRNLRSGRRYHV